VGCIKTQGRVIQAGNGTRIPHPAVLIRRQAMQKIREFSGEFGFTPAARARLEFIGKEEDGDEDDKFFGGPKPAKPKKGPA
jgi:P27 family predicted phage terminase small subunit